MKNILFLALAYLVAGWLGLLIPFTGSHITLVWLPTGIAVAALLRWGHSVWPGIFLGAFLVNLVIGSSVPLAAGIAIGNTLGPIVTAMWLQRVGFRASFERQKDVGLLITGACLGMVLSALCGVANLYLAGLLPSVSLGSAWLTWWMGDFVGVMLAAPLLLTLSRANISRMSRAPAEFVFWVVVAAPVTWFAFIQDYASLGRTLPLAFLTLPLIAWAALRFGITAAGLSGLFFSVVAAWSTASGRGTFFLGDDHISLLLLWLYMATTVLTGLLIGALQAERQVVEDSLRESKERLEAAASAGIVGVWDWDVAANRLVWDKVMYQLYGIHENDWGGAYEAWVRAIHPEDKAYTEGEIRAALQGEREYAPEFRVVWPDGSVHHIKAASQTVFDERGKPLRMIGVNYDVTEQKNIEQTLEQKIAERTAALSVAKEAAEAASRAKSSFLANMSHELRTPMNAIMGMTSIALRQSADARLKDQLGKIDNASRHLLAVINDILDISKIEARRMTLEKRDFVLGGVLENLISVIGQHVSEKGLTLSIDVPADIARLALRGDALRLSQILLNLTGNSVKFTDAGTIAVRIRALRHTQAGVLLRFEVQDTGIGIPAADQERLFTPFEQADGSMTRKYGGTGLGLAISKQLAILMGGEVGVESQLGRGSTFWFTAWIDTATEIVMPAPAKKHDSAEEQLRAGYANVRILLVEDEPINQEVSKELLQAVGLAVDLAEDGNEAVALAKQNDYTLILMDMQMPNLNGVDATKAIRALPGYAETPILAMTANAYDEDRRVCVEAGMNDHIGKPVDPDILFATLLKWLPEARS